VIEFRAAQVLGDHRGSLAVLRARAWPECVSAWPAADLVAALAGKPGEQSLNPARVAADRLQLGSGQLGGAAPGVAFRLAGYRCQPVGHLPVGPQDPFPGELTEVVAGAITRAMTFARISGMTERSSRRVTSFGAEGPGLPRAVTCPACPAGSRTEAALPDLPPGGSHQRGPRLPSRRARSSDGVPEQGFHV
jgi:hypothetical protein